MIAQILRCGVLLALAAPALFLAVLALPSFLGWPWSESRVGLLTRTAFLASFGAVAAAGLAYAAGARAPVIIHLGGWFSKDDGFSFDLLVDGWSLGFAALSIGICGVVSSFSFRYLHREPGFNRYFVLLVCFVGGLLLVALAGSVEVLFAGWELLGLSSALLVAFFHERPAPVDNGFRVLAFYRIGDACMLSAAVLLHHWAGSDSLSLLFSGGASHLSRLGADHVVAIAVLLIAAAAAKSALLPFSTWLPRAMEGPTPSSAVYYGALSIHAGCFLLLRASALVQYSATTRGLTAAAGLATAGYAALSGRAQTDVKSKLCFASLTQVGIIVVEIALGWNTLAFLHMIGNICLRLLQFLSAPNILHDLHQLENDLGGSLAAAEEPPAAWGGALYLFALERGFLDGLLDRWLAEPLERLAAALESLDRRLCRIPAVFFARGGDVG
ncbi:MAG TPA: proton-conducting transporter membrane subunit [Elusimicrobiota bacterium]|nr:proton-conducting transporter membrane subunit [Elusimicrobiota bacterium]